MDESAAAQWSRRAIGPAELPCFLLYLINFAKQNWFKRDSSAVLNSSVAYIQLGLTNG